jgi:hypothetical protein
MVGNVPYLPVPPYLAGARLQELFPVVPIIGNMTLEAEVLRYAGCRQRPQAGSGADFRWVSKKARIRRRASRAEGS